ncbi:MAG TPA: arylamine N-acetyltransferase [Caulobacteraceae bacterium]|nr:arylamine N-acetyltransferase [Caulobacteraceae bacterium]
MSELAAYLDRVGFEGEARPDLGTLRALHRRHLLAVPYENLDVQLGRPLTPDPKAAFDKVVHRRRGGWCYEMNGTLGHALSLIGFSVTRMAGGVVRSMAGDDVVGNHLVLKVDLPEGPMIADVGFGDGPLDPYPLEPAAFSSGVFDFRLERLDDGWWRLHNHPKGGAPNYDFRPEPAEEALLAQRCQTLQTAETSIFVQNLLCFRHREDGFSALRGRVLRRATPEASEDTLLNSPRELTEALGDVFGLDVPEAAGLWDKVAARHDEIFAAG